ncbi:segregation and condensation protein A [Legionella israelensis]|uniref:Segregation and condensation protein A n=1 Tax=Legionella israelensis TaxID=454 RepID=A0A0W0VL51_9GAMM|nr:segregation/condensation protein A [Legionella israelensis]KTD20843.1 segregation and condensation protein A [Legionella israelensis]QBS08478.1 segregation/condensation protein A [Legionella israelensis]SCY27334.1 condensin subunit ScpA [Legionella israelensis DSM 19235]STX58125.1 segregation and condensation protein A [Legionella israelensis]
MQMELTETSDIQVFIDGKPLTDLPKDLFIPPDAFEILLDSFSGPLDLLLYLIKKQNIDILNIPIIRITQQYLQYIEFMEKHRMELAAEYLLMAAMLAEIKSRFLLPTTSSEAEEEEDPRMALVRRLQAYEQIKSAAEKLDSLERHERDVFTVQLHPDQFKSIKHFPEVNLSELVYAIQQLIIRDKHYSHHQILREPLSVKDRMNRILSVLEKEKLVSFQKLYTASEGKAGIIVSFLAILELAKLSLLTITQIEVFAPIYLQAIHDE